MAQQKRGLGKGLGALIPTAPASVARADAGEDGTGARAPGEENTTRATCAG